MEKMIIYGRDSKKMYRGLPTKKAYQTIPFHGWPQNKGVKFHQLGREIMLS